MQLDVPGPPRTSVVVVEAQLSDTGLLPLRKLRELGLPTTFVTNRLERYADLAAYDELVDDPGLAVLRADSGSSTAVTEAIERSGVAPLAVFTTCDYNVPVVAELAERFGLPGLNPTAAWSCRDKLRTRRALGAAGAACPRYARPTSVDELAGAVAHVGLPCVVKPMTESASVDVLLCFSQAEAEEHYAHITARRDDARGQRRPAGVLVEEYLLGYEVSAECLAVDGQHHVLGITDKRLSAAPTFSEIGEVFPSTLPASIHEACARTALTGLAAVGHDFGFAHVEMRVVDGVPVIVEINARLAGALIPWLLDTTLGIDTVQESLLVALGRPSGLPSAPRGAAAVHYFFSPSGGVVRNVRGVDVARRIRGVQSVEVHAATGDRLRPSLSNHESFGQLRVTADTAAEAARICDLAVTQVVVALDAAADHPSTPHGFDPTGG